MCEIFGLMNSSVSDPDSLIPGSDSAFRLNTDPGPEY
jgi:hypothetical protein